jgi:hypothetical protein
MPRKNDARVSWRNTWALAHSLVNAISKIGERGAGLTVIDSVAQREIEKEREGRRGNVDTEWE